MHRIDHSTADVTDPLKPLFTEGNPGLGAPATVVTDDWLNDVQENIMKVLEAAGITPTKGDEEDLYDALQALYGGALTTPPQFDDDTSGATTEFVQRALGNDRGYVGLTSNTSLTADHAGMDIYASTSSGAITLSLPAASLLKAGAKFKVYNTGVDDVIVTRVGGDSIVLNTTSNTVTAVTLKSGDSIELVSLGTGSLWYHSGGTGQLGNAGAFAASLAASGYQKLPGGLIMQWGRKNSVSAPGTSAVSFGLTFPTGVLCVQLTGIQSAAFGTNNAVACSVQSSGISTTGFTIIGDEVQGAVSLDVFWLAIGY